MLLLPHRKAIHYRPLSKEQSAEASRLATETATGLWADAAGSQLMRQRPQVQLQPHPNRSKVAVPTQATPVFRVSPIKVFESGTAKAKVLGGRL